MRRFSMLLRLDKAQHVSNLQLTEPPPSSGYTLFNKISIYNMSELESDREESRKRVCSKRSALR